MSKRAKLIALQRKLRTKSTSPPRPVTEARAREIAREEAHNAVSSLRLSSAPVRRGGCG